MDMTSQSKSMSTCSGASDKLIPQWNIQKVHCIFLMAHARRRHKKGLHSKRIPVAGLQPPEACP